jgi:uncharacterized protein (TIGR02453 family)
MLSPQILKFLKSLKKNNSKTWFDANRTTYEACRSEYFLLVESILQELKKIDPTLTDLEAKKCMFRINRDIRFSKNKDPYKTNFGSYFSKGGKTISCAGYYLHIEPGASFVAGGYWMPEAQDLKKIRTEIDYCLDEFKELTNKRDFKSTFGALDKEYTLSRPPQGYDADHPGIEWLKLKSFTVSTPLTDQELTQQDIKKKIVNHFKVLVPFIHFLNRSLD